MAFVRVWWPPVVVGLVVAFLGIGVVEVAGMPADDTPVAASASARPQPRPASVAPAAIERDDDVAEPESEAESEPESESEPEPEAKPKPAPEPSPTPVAKPSPSPVPKPAPTPVVLAPSPSPGPSLTVPPLPVPPPPVRPAEVLDLRSWKLTLPVGRKGHPLELLQPKLSATGNNAFFRLRPDRGVMFRAPVVGVTTENSKYPRAELREMTPDGRRKAAWASTAGRHVMTITQAITGTPRAKPHVVAGQIHDAEDDIIMIRLEGSRLFVESDGDDVGLLDPHYRLGTRFTVSIAATKPGIRVTYQRTRGTSDAAGGAPKPRVVDVRRAGHGWYFKAGCYVQSNPDRGDRPGAFGEVVIYALTVRHT